MPLDSAQYVPILSLKPAEMAALEELPDKDKELLLPVISIKRWANSNTIEKSYERVKKAIGEQKWIADLDKEALASLKKDPKKLETPVFQELDALAKPNDGYANWVEFITNHPELIPVAQLDDMSEIDQQFDKLIELNRPIVVRFLMAGEFAISNEAFNASIVSMMSKSFDSGLFIILDYGDLNRVNLLEHHIYSNLINRLHEIFPLASFAISGTSFPYSFSGSYKGEIPIYERQIFNKVVSDCSSIKLVYSDRASTRAVSLKGGGGTPPPRIDYPLKNDWRFIRKEFSDPDEDKAILYREAAIEMMHSDYWDKELPPLWGTQMIEKTSLGDSYGITSANRATAVRINLHLYQQLHYLDDLSAMDTDEEWVD